MSGRKEDVELLKNGAAEGDDNVDGANNDNKENKENNNKDNDQDSIADRIKRMVSSFSSAKPPVVPKRKVVQKNDNNNDIDQFESQLTEAMERGDTKEVIRINREIARKSAEEAADTIVARRSEEMELRAAEERKVTEFQQRRNSANERVWKEAPEILEIDELFKVAQTGDKKALEDAQAKAKNSPLYRELGRVWEEHPDWVEHPDSPLWALELARSRVAQKKDDTELENTEKEKDAERQRRVSNANFISSSRSSGRSIVEQGNDTKVELTEDQRYVARRMGLSEDKYAKFMKRTPLETDTRGPVRRK